MFRIISLFIFISISFTAQSQYYLLGPGAQQLGNGEIRLTNDEDSEVGAIWAPQKKDRTKDFIIKSEVFFGIPSKGDGADGMAFVMHNTCRNIGGKQTMGGKDMGYKDISPSIIVELDSYLNSSDPNDRHIGILRNGNSDHTAPGSIPPVPFVNTLKDGVWHSFNIEWIAATHRLNVYFDDIFITSLAEDIVNTVFNGKNEVFWGFTASTGSAYNEHKIKLPEIPDTHKATICQGETVKYKDISPSYVHDNGSVLSWSPTTGINNTSAQYPEFSPTKTTKYVLTISDECGSVIRRNFAITVLEKSTSTTVASICDGENYTFNGKEYNATGTYTAILTNAKGCDSTATLMLTVNMPSESTTVASICDDEKYTFNGKEYGEVGTYIASLTNAKGCDSTATLVLSYRPFVRTIEGSDYACEGDTLYFSVENGDQSATLRWYLDGYELTKLRNKDFVNLKLTDPGTYKLRLDASHLACQASDVFSLFVSPAPVAQFEYAINEADFEITLTDLSVPINIVNEDKTVIIPQTALWTVTRSDGIFETFNGDAGPVTISHQVGILLVNLTVNNSYGCVDTAKQVLKTDTISRLFVPTAFCPTHRSQGLHKFAPTGTGLRKYIIYVYDSWGNTVWFSNVLTPEGQPADAWTGECKGGLMPAGTYNWKVEVVYKSGKSETRWGNLSLLR